MRILILANNDVGLYKFRKELIEELLDRGNDLFISLPNGDKVRPFEEMGCTFIDTPVDRRGMNPARDLALFWHYRRMMREVNPDLVVTYTVKPNVYGGMAARMARKQYAVNITGLGTALESRGPLRLLVSNLYKLALKDAEVVFFENADNRDKMVALGACKQEQTYLLNGAGVNLDEYTYQEYPHNNAMRFLFIGRVMAEKGVDELLNATKRLVEDGVACHLEIVGPCEEAYDSVLEQCQKEGWLSYHGYQQDVKPYIRLCDCFVLPSYHEGMANTNLECAASGRPVITSDVPGCREAVLAGKSGLLCQSKDVDSLYQAMKKMTDMAHTERETMGRSGREHMMQAFDKKNVVKATVNQLLRSSQ